MGPSDKSLYRQAVSREFLAGLDDIQYSVMGTGRKDDQTVGIFYGYRQFMIECIRMIFRQQGGIPGRKRPTGRYMKLLRPDVYERYFRREAAASPDIDNAVLVFFQYGLRYSDGPVFPENRQITRIVQGSFRSGVRSSVGVGRGFRAA